MSNGLDAGLAALDAIGRSPCGTCGLRFGSCVHTRSAELPLHLLREIVELVRKEHPAVGSPDGPRCKTCKTPFTECPTRRGVASILRVTSP